MKKIRKLSTLLVTTLLCFLLSGCYSMVMECAIQPDGSGAMVAAFGMREDYYAIMYQTEQEENPTDETFEEYMLALAEAEGLVPYIYEGVTYWGMEEMITATSLEEMNAALFADENGEPDGTGSLILDENGDLTLTLILDAETMSDHSDGEDLSELTEEDMAYLREFMPMDFIFYFPEEIGKVRGDASCYVLDGSTVTVDLLSAVMSLQADPTQGAKTFVFSTADPTFVDTPITAWYTAAAEAMADGGLMAGIGDRRFAPDQNLTVGELAQILARATGLDVGTGESGYWAEIAVESCLEKGYITDRGEVTQTNYGVSVDRQEAIAAMQRASGLTPTGTITAEDIPDFDSIRDEFKQDILDAYNTGVTAGTDANLTCSPTMSLTRAQVAQLFYALGWTSPLA